MTDHDDDTEALARVLEADGWLGHDDELMMYDLRNIAATVLASDWLAAYVARKVDAAERERASEHERANDNARKLAETRKRAEQAERERDEARSEERRRTLLWLADEIDPTGYGWTSVRDAERFRQRLRGLAAEPASDRPLTLDEHLAEIERQIEERRASAPRGAQHRAMTAVLDVVRAYRAEVRRNG